MSADVSVVERTLESVTSGNLRRKAAAAGTGSASPEHMTCRSGSASQSSVAICSWPGVRQSTQSTRLAPK
eukprot:1618240-Prymnesium_polylepis.1